MVRNKRKHTNERMANIKDGGVGKEEEREKGRKIRREEDTN